MAEEEQTNIQVRALSGESIVVTILRTKTVDDLKRLLVLQFSLASTSPNFHLFFKGARLSLNSPLHTLAIQNGEFLVLIPFVKKNKKPAQKPDSVGDMMPAHKSSGSRFADAAYSVMVQGLLSSMISESSRVKEEHSDDGTFSGNKRRRSFEADGGNVNEERGTPRSGVHTKSTKKSWTSSSSSQERCYETNQLSPTEMIQHLQNGMGSDDQIVHVEEIRARKAQYVNIPAELSNNTKSVLKCMGINKLYSHQAESILASLKGKNVVVATMTSSGKSLCYNVPVLEVLSQDLLACALYLFPTKALAQDQLRALRTMTKAYDTSINIGVYDGDTCQSDRILFRSNARLLITNPDMLHMTILPQHGQFRRILANLRFVIIDEAHMYKGAFGCHTSLILRRLRRLCSHVYGTDPSFIFSTATSANPREHCMVSLKIDNLVDLTAKICCVNSPFLVVSYLFAEMVQHGLRCIAFCKSRKLTELVLSYTREILQKTAPNLVDKISAYRAGYVPEERRKIERDFFSGKLSGIAATNALELGIDVGHIDATMHLGFPGSISSLWQQAGRSGRRGKTSIAVYVGFEGPLDQYFMKCPRKLFDSPIECCHVDSQNVQVVEQHLICAAFEHPLSLQYDETHFGPGINSAVMLLKNKGTITCNRTRDDSARIWRYIGKEKMPSRGISIRAIETIKYRVMDTQRNELLEEIEESKAFFQVYDGAIYMNQGKSYLVKKLDISERIAWCQQAHVDYYTRIVDFTNVHVMGGDAAYPVRACNQSKRTTAQARSCTVTTTWLEFRKVVRVTNKARETVPLSLPSYSFESQAAWVGIPQLLKKAVGDSGLEFREGQHAASHALLNVVPLFVRCNYSDLAPECPHPHGTHYFPERILVYDQHPGGTGVSKQIQPYFTELLNAALELLTSCHCHGYKGCPNCVQSVVCHQYNDMIHKEAAIMIIRGVLDAEKSYFEEVDKSLLQSS
ncbi:Uncharacterized ATP-dependent helicase YprA [Linum perenne]